jgi:hypothetical protein
MPIAQPDVAGEGGFCPPPSENVNASVVSPRREDEDAAALAAFRTDNTNLPWVVFRAAHRATNVDELPQRARSLFAALARTVDASRPYAAIYASRTVLVDRALHSRRTLYRALADLQDADLIRRTGQLRIATEGYEGRFGRTHIHFTEKAAILLGLAEPPTVKTAAGDANGEGAAAPNQGFKKPSANVALGAYIEDLSPGSFQKRQPGQLPADLQRLRSLGFHEFLIFRLMKEARQHGKLLSDVVAVVWEHLKAAHRPINYLRKLLTTPTDFAHQRLARQTAISAAQQAQREAHEVQAALSRCAGQTFFDATGTRRIVISADVSTTHDVREAQPRVMAGAWQAGFVDALRAGRLQLATAELDAQFAAQRREQQRAHALAVTPRGDGPDRGLDAPVLSRVGDTQLGILARLVGARRPTSDARS